MLVAVENLSKIFLIPHEKKTTLFEYLRSFLRAELTYEKFFALARVNFEVKGGEFIGVIGENGSGKTTLLKIIAGIFSPSSGRVKVEAPIVPLLELGLGFQPDLSARENVFLYGIFMGLTRREVEKKLNEIFDFAGVAKFIDMPLKNYSSGMQARLAFATAINAPGDLFLVDEVLAVGDENFYGKCLAVFENFKSVGKTLIFVSHNLPQVERLCDKTLLLSGGRQIFFGPTKAAIQMYQKNIRGEGQ